MPRGCPGRKRGWSVYFFSPLSVSLCLRSQLLLDGAFLELSVIVSNDSGYLLPVVAYPRMPHHPLWFPLILSFVNSPFIQLRAVIPFEWAISCCDIVSKGAEERVAQCDHGFLSVFLTCLLGIRKFSSLAVCIFLLAHSLRGNWAPEYLVVWRSEHNVDLRKIIHIWKLIYF